MYASEASVSEELTAEEYRSCAIFTSDECVDEYFQLSYTYLDH
jgi:hypothetical protein